MKNFSGLILFILCIVLLSSNIYPQYSIYENTDIDKVKASLLDNGRMWTFDDIPYEYFNKEYGFNPTEEWLKHVQKSALQFGGGCSAAFVSENGLIMTNHHCGRGQLSSIQEEGENLLRDGFYAPTLQEERNLPGLYVDQLLFIEDVTEEVLNAFNSGTTDEEKVNNRDELIGELESQYSEESGLSCRIVKLYNGGKYSIYGYKRYNDIRLVMSPDFQIAATGWDWDNFTYPRYELDFAFYRAYDEEGNPVQTEHYFTWSEKGANEDELIFTVGRPGNTDRLLSVTQLEFMRDITYPPLLLIFNEVYDVYFELFQKYPERESELLNSVMGWGNARKSYAGRLMGLRDEYIMARKKDFENELKEKIKPNPELNETYGHIWTALETAFSELKEFSTEASAYRLFRFARPIYFSVASDIIKYAEQMKLPEDDREEEYKKTV